eukprot:jgi/Bigna1/78376/fgenesh1_pg.54_\
MNGLKLRVPSANDIPLYFLQIGIALISVFLCLIELLPLPATTWSFELRGLQTGVLMALFGFVVLLSICNSHRSSPWDGSARSRISAATLLAILNCVPILTWVATTSWYLWSNDCKGTQLAFSKKCNKATVLLDAIGIVTARLARIDMGLCVLLAARGETTWLLGATGWVGFPEGIPLHRLTGWWCIVQSAIHSMAYFLYYYLKGNLWRGCFPVPSSSSLNRLGLVNFFGVLAFIASLLLGLLALPQIRKSWYHLFQQTHLPLALVFIVGSALHDLPMLMFSVPGLAEWYFGRLGSSSSRIRSSSSSSSICYRNWLGCNRTYGSICSASVRLKAKAQVLNGTSAPWIKLTIENHDKNDVVIADFDSCSKAAPRGLWASVRVIPLSTEFHPLSVAVAGVSPRDENWEEEGAETTQRLIALVSSKAGDWSQALLNLATKKGEKKNADDGICDIEEDAACSFEVEMEGPFPVGGGGWSLRDGIDSGALITDSSRDCKGHNNDTALLLIAGGSGIIGWLPGLCDTSAVAAGDGEEKGTKGENVSDGRQHRCHLIWCVRKETDYKALAKSLPSAEKVDVTVYVTQSAAPNGSPLMINEASSGDVFESQSPGSFRTKINICGSSSLMKLVSLLACFTGLVINYWAWYDGVYPHLQTTSMTMFRYTVVYRCLPIVVTIVSIIVILMAGSILMRSYAERPVRYHCAPVIKESRDGVGSRDDSRDDSIIESENYEVSLLAASTHQEQKVASESSHLREHTPVKHTILAGRPDLEKVIFERLDALDASTKRILVVAACGPDALVNASRKAVEAVSNERQKGRSRRSAKVHLRFAGAHSNCPLDEVDGLKAIKLVFSLVLAYMQQ